MTGAIKAALDFADKMEVGQGCIVKAQWKTHLDAACAEVERVEAKLEACHSVLALIHRQAKTGLRFAPDNAALNYIAEAGASLPAVVANAQRLARAARGQS